jgi:Tol biopolymer transport system component
VVSVTPAGQPANAYVTPMAVTDDGNRVAFVTGATNLAPAPHGIDSLYVRDRKANTTTRVNIGTNGLVSPVYDVSAGMDPSGSTVTWVSPDYKVWARHLSPGSTQRVDVSSAEVPSTGVSIDPTITDDGKHVVFSSNAANLVPGDTNGVPDVFVRDLAAGTTVRASLASGNQQSMGLSEIGVGSADGRYVAFESESADLVPGDTNQLWDVFLHDMVLGTTERVSIGQGGVEGDGDAGYPSISGDGMTVVFQSRASNLVANDANQNANTFERDTFADVTTMVDRSIGLANGNSGSGWQTAVSFDGSVVATDSDATNLITGDTNGQGDVYVLLPESMGPASTFQTVVTNLITDFGGLSDGGLPDPIGDMVNGRVTVGHFVALLDHDPTWAEDREPVARLYDAFFERRPDLAGLQYWSAKHAKGTDLATIASKFAESSEFGAKYGSVANGAFVKLVYANVLDRPADAAGLAHWTAELGKGLTRGKVMVQFSESGEGRRHLAAHVDPTLIGLAMLHRLPTPAELAAAGKAFAWGGDEAVGVYYLDLPAYASAH